MFGNVWLMSLWPSDRSTGFSGIILDEKATLALQSAAPEAGSESHRQSERNLWPSALAKSTRVQPAKDH